MVILWKIFIQAAFLFVPIQVIAMDFRENNGIIYGSGEIRMGDSEALVRFLETLPVGDVDSPKWVLSLNSPGGSLLEGIRLGEIIREAGLSTRVEVGNECISACAITFLGGTVRGANSRAASREIEFGGILGFHGFYFAEDRLEIANETLDSARILNALILSYASQMGSVDGSLLAELISIHPAEIEKINTPRKIRGLGINLIGASPRPPRGWAVNACQVAVAKILNPLDSIGFRHRVIAAAEPIPHLAKFRQWLIDDRYPAERANAHLIRQYLNELEASDAIDLLLGGAVYGDRPNIGVWRVPLERGGGFYYDFCYAMTDFRSIDVFLIDRAGSRLATKRGSVLIGFPTDLVLW